MEQMNEMWGSTESKLNADSPKAAYFKQSKFAMFVHWGLYSHLGGVWQDKTYHGITEWLMCTAKISAEDYAKVAGDFNPSEFNAADFVATAKNAGMKYIIVTAKHHEGFAMFKSVDKFNVVDATPFKRDIMAELAEECQRQDIGLGFYYSQFQDWQAYNRWDPALENADFDKYFREKCIPQITELLTNYGKLALIWFDTPGKMTLEQSQEIVDLVHRLQPQALVNSRIGNGVGDYSSMNDNEVPAKRIPGLWECIRTSNNSWGYSAIDKDFCSAFEILQDLVHVVARGGTYMVNVGPDPLGNIPQPCRYALLETGKWLKKYGDQVIYSAESSPWDSSRSWGDCTRRGNCAYFVLNKWLPGQTISDCGFKGKIKEVIWLGENMELDFEQNGSYFKIHLPMQRGNDLMEVIQIICEDVIPDTDESVIYAAADIPCHLKAESAILVNAELKHDFWAERFGEFYYTNIIHNFAPDSKAVWEFELEQAGYYRILIKYQRVDLDNRVWRISNGEGNSIERWLPDAQQLPPPPLQNEPTARFHIAKAGVMYFKNPGRQTLTVTAADNSVSSPLHLAEIILEKF